MEILITGPFGTIGAHVLARLIDAGHAVTCFDLDTQANRKKSAKLPASVRVVFGDVTRLDDLRAVVRGKEAVVHLAAIIPPGSEAQPALAEKVNVDGTRNVVEAISLESPSAVLVFPSSVSVHGYSSGREPPVRVDAPLDGREGAVGHAFFLGSGADSQCTWRAFISTHTRALGLGEAPEAWFGTAPYYTDWMDTSESERLFRFQTHGLPAYAAAISRKLLPVRLLLTPLRPIVRWRLGRAIEDAKARENTAR